MITEKEYQSLNKSFKRELIYKLRMNAGFFSEYNSMILAMLYSLEHRIQFKLCAGSTNFHPNGWNGFFVPFCEEVEDNSKHYRTCDWRYALKLIIRDLNFSACKSLIPYINPSKKHLKTQDIFGRCRNPQMTQKRHCIPELGLSGNTQEICSILINITWRYNKPTQETIDKLKNSVNLPNTYIGFHIRGGDKFIEHKIERKPPVKHVFYIFHNLLQLAPSRIK